jgi:hypothetical protein
VHAAVRTTWSEPVLSLADEKSALVVNADKTSGNRVVDRNAAWREASIVVEVGS